MIAYLLMIFFVVIMLTGADTVNNLLAEKEPFLAGIAVFLILVNAIGLYVVASYL